VPFNTIIPPPPFASTTVSGLVSTADQAFGGKKSFGDVLGLGLVATGSLPSAASYEGYIVYDSDTQTVKFSNGSVWAGMGGGGGGMVVGDPVSGAGANTVLFSDGSSNLQTGGIFWDENTGRMGINNNTPQEALSVDGNITTTGHAIFTDANVYGVSPTITALPGGGAPGATLLGNETNFVFAAASPGDSVMLPPALAGMHVTVFNITANSVDVFPDNSSPEHIDSLGNNNPYTLPAGTSVEFWSNDVLSWYTVKSANSGFTGSGTYAQIPIFDGATSFTSTPNLAWDFDSNVLGITAAPATGGLWLGSNLATLVPGSHLVQFNASATQTPLMISGGSGVIEIWKDSTPTVAVAMGLAIPGNALGSDLVFSTYSGTWIERLRMASNGNFAVSSNRIFVDFGNERVGIGTSTPSQTLDVAGIGVFLDILGLGHFNTGDLPGAAAGNRGYIAYDITTDTVKFSNGSAWANIGGGGGGITALGVIGSTPNANAATISGVTLNLEPASASFGGVVTTGTQTLAGDKTLSGVLALSGATGNTLVVDTSTLVADATNNRVGIGTATPAKTLDVAGAMQMTGDFDFTPSVDDTGHLGTDALRWNRIRGNTIVSGASLIFDSNIRQTSDGVFEIRKANNSTNVASFDTTNVRFGVGTATPSKALDVVGQGVFSDILGLPKIATASLPTAAAGNEGYLVYDDTLKTVRISNGTSWLIPGTVNAVGALGASPNANGASISGSTLTLQPASASFPGAVTTGTQSFAGTKTFGGGWASSATCTLDGGSSLLLGGGGTDSVFISQENTGSNFFFRCNIGSGAASTTVPAFRFKHVNGALDADDLIVLFQNSAADHLFKVSQVGDSSVLRLLQLGKIATGSLPAAAAGNEGSIAYDDTTNTVKFSNGSVWQNIDHSTTDYKATDSITAFAGGGQASATGLGTEVNFVTVVATNNDSVALPSAVLGRRILVFNRAEKPMDVFPRNGDGAKIDALATDAAFSVAAGTSKEFWGETSTQWVSR
jgi:hypothetical protein